MSSVILNMDSCTPSTSKIFSFHSCSGLLHFESHQLSSCLTSFAASMAVTPVSTSSSVFLQQQHNIGEVMTELSVKCSL